MSLTEYLEDEDKAFNEIADAAYYKEWVSEAFKDELPTEPDHYDHPIPPLEYIIKNDLDFCQGNVVKYVTRFRDKGGKNDLEKAIRYLEELLKEYK